MLFLALGSLYYFKEYSRLFQEQKVENRLIFSECQHINKLLGVDKECVMPIVENIEALKETRMELLIAFFIVLFFILPASYFLAMISLSPMRNSIDTIDNFINSIVHDINTPLSLIKLNAQSINKSLQNKNKEKNFRILKGVEDIESLEEQLLFSIKSDRYILKNSIFDLKDLIKSRAIFYNDIRETVQVDIELNLFKIKADNTLFIRMIDNIVLNAIKFSHRNSLVNIKLKDSLLIIEDFGIGIQKPKEIFIKYYRENNKIKGLGLGLFIVKSIATLHNLEVIVESKIDFGTCFKIDLKKIKVD